MRLPALLAALAALMATAVPAAAGNGPSFNCRGTQAGSIEAQVCGSPDLSALDRQMASVYAAALAKAKNEHPPTLAAEQRGWIKGRNDCWKADDRGICVRDAYWLRIAELQARYRLLPGRGPLFYVCNGQPSNEVVATFFATDPPSAVVEHGDRTSMMFLQPGAGGARYAGSNESLWLHHGEARVVWGYGAQEMTCALRP